MFLNILCRPFRRRSADDIKRERIRAAMRLVKKSYLYLDKQGCRVLSTELPDTLLRSWLTSWPGKCGDAPGYVTCHGNKPPQLEAVVMLYDYVLDKRFQRGRVGFRQTGDERQRAADVRGLKFFVAFLEYIHTARMNGRPIMEFDIFDFDSYDAIAARTGVTICEDDPEAADEGADAPPKPDVLLYNKLTNKHIDGIIPVLKKYRIIDLAQYDIPVCVIFRDFGDFLHDGSLKIRDYAKDMLVGKVEYIDDQTFELELTRAVIYRHRYQSKPKRGFEPGRVPNTTQRITVRRDGNMQAPFIEPSAVYNLLYMIRRYDEFTQGRRRRVECSDRAMKRSKKEYFRDFQQVFPKDCFDWDRMFEMID